MKKRKSLKTLLALALTLVLSLGIAVPAFALGGGTEASPLKAFATKALQMPEGTTTPNATFQFTATPKAYNGGSTPADLAMMPAITIPNLVFTSADAGTTASGTKTVVKDSPIAPASWANAGVYTYTITETSGTYIIADPDQEKMYYSGASYDVIFVVANGVTNPYVKELYSDMTVIDIPGQTIGKITIPPTTIATGGWSVATFTNTYLKNRGGVDPTDPTNSSVDISKKVNDTPATGDKTKYFAFNVTAEKATVEPIPPLTGKYKAYVVDTATNAVVTSTANYAGTLGTDGYGQYIEFTNGTPLTVNLKHGQTLRFTDMFVGSYYSVTEQATPQYIPSFTRVENGGGTPATGSGAVNTALTAATKVALGENTNSAAYLNTHDFTTPSGLNINDLPFIVMLALAASAVVAFVVVRYRKKARHTN